MKKISNYIYLFAIYFSLIVVSVFVRSLLAGINIETTVKTTLETGAIAALIYLGFTVFLLSKKNHAVVIVVCFLLCILLGCGGYRLYENGRTETPSSLTEFGEKYPEAKKYVSGYPKYKDKPFDADLRLDVTKGEIPLFIQWDKRWGYQYYGDNLLGISGCGPTCISMLVCGLTGSDEWNPYRVAQFSEENGYYVEGTGTSWNLMTDGAGKLGLDSEQGTISAEYISNNLSASTPMICSMKPGDFTYTGHFIVLTGIDSKGDIIVNDPNSKKNSKKHWSLETLVPQIKGIWKYTANIE
jgi:hypothetical protein